MARQAGEAARTLSAERRALDRLDPVVQLVAARERIGLLLDRATASATVRIDRELAGLRRVADRLPALAATRAGAARASLDAAGAALGVLGPQATLDRGYAIVRRAEDGLVVRDPAEAPAGTRLAVRVARGDLPATAERR